MLGLEKKEQEKCLGQQDELANYKQGQQQR